MNRDLMTPCLNFHIFPPVIITTVRCLLINIKSLLLLLLNHHNHGIVKNNLQMRCTPRDNGLDTRRSKCTILIKLGRTESSTVIRHPLRDNTLPILWRLHSILDIDTALLCMTRIFAGATSVVRVDIRLSNLRTLLELRKLQVDHTTFYLRTERTAKNCML